MPIIQKSEKSNYRITLPKKLIKDVKWNKGDLLVFHLNKINNKISLEKVPEKKR